MGYSKDQTQCPQNELLDCFADVIGYQVENEHLEDALKTMKKLKLFNLNSSDPKDLLNFLDKQGYKKYLPPTNLKGC